MHVKPCLEKLNQDADHDVQHFANEALESKSIICKDLCFCVYRSEPIRRCLSYTTKSSLNIIEVDYSFSLLFL